MRTYVKEAILYAVLFVVLFGFVIPAMLTAENDIVPPLGLLIGLVFIAVVAARYLPALMRDILDNTNQTDSTKR